MRSSGRHHERFDAVPLTRLRHGGDIRPFNGQVPPWPEARQAIEVPRWWDTQPG